MSKPDSAQTIDSNIDLTQLVQRLKNKGQELGFQQIGITDTDLSAAETHLQQWLQRGFHGDMDYMQRHGLKRSRPEELVPGTIRVISARMDYFPPQCADTETVLTKGDLAFISRYALGRDYHKVLRKRLQQLADFIQQLAGPFGYRVFTDSAPVMEKAIAEKAGLGWIGKHSNVIAQHSGSWFFLGEIYTDLPLPADQASNNHCGTCTACIEACPTAAIVAPYQVDARRCISYLTIEYKGSIPIELRPFMGNRIYGCDDCQLYCPWNRFSKPTKEKDFNIRNRLDAQNLLVLFNWTEQEFLQYTEGSAIRRIGYHCWLRNIAVALGNAPKSPSIVKSLHERQEHASPLVREHVQWALQQQLQE